MVHFRVFIFAVLCVLPFGCVHAGGEEQRCPICFEDSPQIVLHHVNAQAKCHASCADCARRMFIHHTQCDTAAYHIALVQAMLRAFFEGDGNLDLDMVLPCDACSGGAAHCDLCRHCNHQCPLCREPLTDDDIRNIRDGGIPAPMPGEPSAAASGEPVRTGESPYLVPAIVGVAAGGMTIAAISYLVWKHRKDKKKNRNNRTSHVRSRARAAA